MVTQPRIVLLFLWRHKGCTGLSGLTDKGRVIYKSDGSDISTPPHGSWGMSDDMETLVIHMNARPKAADKDALHIPHEFHVDHRAVALTYTDNHGRVLQACKIEEKHQTKAFWNWPAVDKRDMVILHIYGPSAYGWAANMASMPLDMSKATAPQEVAEHWSQHHDFLKLKDSSKFGIAIHWPGEQDEWIEIPPGGQSIQDAIKESIWVDETMQDIVEFSVEMQPGKASTTERFKERTKVQSGLYSFRNHNRSAPYRGATGSRSNATVERLASLLDGERERLRMDQS